MDRRTARAAGVALLVVLVVGIAAATLTSTLQAGNGVGGVPAPGGNQGNGSGNGNLSSDPGRLGGGDFLSQRFCFPVVQTLEFKLGLLGLWLLLAVLLFWRLPRLVAAGILASASVFLLGVYAVLLGLCNQGFQTDTIRNVTNLPEPNLDPIPKAAQEGAEGAGAYISSNPLLTAAIVTVAVALLVALVYLHGADRFDITGRAPSTTGERDLEEEYSAETLQMLGQAAGDAADRIDQDGDADNEVYRAWREMTGYVDVDRPAASTPREFAAAATAAGMAEPDVAELTDLFEEVRYGGLPATEDAERRAVEALRRIEDSYADTEADR
ncbi:MAG: DUF4129 domain-containing protein [Halobacteriaceae archaeon]